MPTQARESRLALILSVAGACGCTVVSAPRAADPRGANTALAVAPQTVVPIATPAPGSAFDVPKLEGLAIDGKLEDWAGRGLSIEVLASANADRRRVDEFDAQARLGWDNEGLLLAFDVVDKTRVESERDSELYSNDSIELFFATRPGSVDSVQFIVSPGLDPKFSEPRLRFYDKRSSLDLLKATPALVYARQPVEGGYRFEARMPWALLGTEAKLGSEVGLQFYVNDSGADGKKKKLIWYPDDETHQNTSQMQIVRLAARPSPRVTRTTSTRFTGLHSAVLEYAMVTQAPEVVRLTDGASILGTAELKLSGRLGTAKIPFAAPINGTAPRPLTLADSRGTLLTVRQPDRSAFRHRMISDLKVVAMSSVFSGDSFPSIDLWDWSMGEALLGEYQFSTRFYDANHQLVDKPTKPGRYGAVVDIESPRAPTERRYLTLFRTAQKVPWWNERMSATVELPSAVGISPKTQKRQAAMLGGMFLKSLQMASYVAEDVPITLSYLHELGESAAPAGPYHAAYQADNGWWHEQRRQLGDIRPYKYLVHLPAGAEVAGTKLFPAILSLHGAGDVGNDLGLVAHVGPLQKMRQNPDAFPFIVLTPQSPANVRGWNAHLLTDLVREALTKYPIDPERLYVTGGSMGGFGTWALAAAHPELFAAAAVVAGGGDEEDAPKLLELPVWVFHSDDDQVVATERGLELVRALRKRHGRVRFTLYHALGHDSGTPAYQGDQLYAWFLQQRRGHPQQPRATSNDTKPDD